MRITNRKFFDVRADILAPKLLGKYICRNINGQVIKYKITEVEAYMGEADTACHSHKGKTKRTAPMYEQSGTIYVYLCYGIHSLLNIVCGGHSPEAVLIRGVEGHLGPGRVSKVLAINKELNGQDIITSIDLWLEDAKEIKNYKTSTRIGIDYAEDKDKNALLRYSIE